MHTHTIDYYCYHCHCFTVCAFQVKSLIIFSFNLPLSVTVSLEQLFVFNEYNFRTIWLIPYF